MDPERAKRRQSAKVIISEIIMVITVVLTVTILAFLVSGYWLNADFKVERQGLLQISSIPTGANISIDGVESSWLQRTNTSKVLPSGEHTITLTKDGYDSWSKTINVSEGLVYRIHYPRLFPNDRTAEKVLDTSGTTILATASPDHNYILLINNTTEWNLVNLDSEDIKPTKLDISKLFSAVSIAADADKGLFTGEILDIKWDYDGNHALFKIKSSDNLEWVLLDIKDVNKSTNLTKQFGGNFSEIKILDNSSNNLLAIQNSNLHKIDVPGKSVSAVLVENIINFDHYNSNEIIFSAAKSSSETYPYYIGLLKLGDNKITTIKETETPTQVTLSKFYEDKYITILEDKLVSLYKKDDFVKIADFKLSFTPVKMEVGHSGEFITMSSENQIATLDMESTSVHEWQSDNTNFGWIDNDMIYTISDSQLIVYDYDGLNRRTIANNTSNHFPAAITNNKWLYYFSNDSLVREIINN